MSIPKILKNELTRLGAKCPNKSGPNLITAINEEVEYSNATFDSTAARFRKVLKRMGVASFDGFDSSNLWEPI